MKIEKNETVKPVVLATNKTFYKNETHIVNKTINNTWAILNGNSDGVTPDIGSALVIKLGNQS